MRASYWLYDIVFGLAVFAGSIGCVAGLTHLYLAGTNQKPVILQAPAPQHIILQFNDRETGATFKIEGDITVSDITDKISHGKNSPSRERGLK